MAIVKGAAIASDNRPVSAPADCLHERGRPTRRGIDGIKSHFAFHS